MYDYYLAYDDGNMVIRAQKGVPIERYDKTSLKWVVDWDMCGIYSGDIPARVITKEEAEKLISA